MKGKPVSPNKLLNRAKNLRRSEYSRDQVVAALDRLSEEPSVAASQSITDGYWWWKMSAGSKPKIVHVTANATRIRRVGYKDPMPIAGEFLRKVEF